MHKNNKKKLLVLILAYNVEKFIRNVIERIPRNLGNKYQIEILIIDDCSNDKTFDTCKNIINQKISPFKITLISNLENGGYGYVQKIGYFYSIKNNFDFVAMVHGDGQYAPELLNELIEPIIEKKADGVQGSRMIVSNDAIRGGMPLYKYCGNKLITFIQNFILSTSFSEFHSGYRIYSTKALDSIPFYYNSDYFDFDTEIIIQFKLANLRIVELPIPTHYGNEYSQLRSIPYGFKVIATTLRSRLKDIIFFSDKKYNFSTSKIEKFKYDEYRKLEEIFFTSFKNAEKKIN